MGGWHVKKHSLHPSCPAFVPPLKLFQQSPPRFSTNIWALGSIPLLTVSLAGNVQALTLACKLHAPKALLHPHCVSNFASDLLFLTVLTSSLTPGCFGWSFYLPGMGSHPIRAVLQHQRAGRSCSLTACYPTDSASCPSMLHGFARTGITVLHQLPSNLLCCSFSLFLFGIKYKIRILKSLLSLVLGAEA